MKINIQLSLLACIFLSNSVLAAVNDDICNKFVKAYVQNEPAVSVDTVESHKDSSIQKVTYLMQNGVTDLYRCDFHDGKITFYKIDSVAKK